MNLSSNDSIIITQRPSTSLISFKVQCTNPSSHYYQASTNEKPGQVAAAGNNDPPGTSVTDTKSEPSDIPLILFYPCQTSPIVLKDVSDDNDDQSVYSLDPGEGNYIFRPIYSPNTTTAEQRPGRYWQEALSFHEKLGEIFQQRTDEAVKQEDRAFLETFGERINSGDDIPASIRKYYKARSQHFDEALITRFKKIRTEKNMEDMVGWKFVHDTDSYQNYEPRKSLPPGFRPMTPDEVEAEISRYKGWTLGDITLPVRPSKVKGGLYFPVIKPECSKNTDERDG
ncbi:uncharacterized protein I206_107098 [Kwoniella pini CBS 10737]|uniref:Uncharacterized protein n=1 Tax=Kwoniella pini CBS 10737 TaxID=1296096 RepID=A0A1B9HZ65_9TREE|nr:uncharacterized protein I206_05358 [Kwoniella pini CBS 10737]OCF48579.1 hypothetical protein I206_05358 [Kwoniella pini CBS 10737]